MLGVSAFGLESAVWRRLARWGSQRGPEWFVRVAPPIVGVVACAVAGEKRRFIAKNLRRVRGRRGKVSDTVDVVRVFTGYAACLADVLGAGAPNRPAPQVVIHGERHLLDAAADGRGVILATAHTGGWETVGPLLLRDQGLRVMLVEQAESDARANAIQDEARSAPGVTIVRVGDDPLSALPLTRHLRQGGVVALQVDRAPVRVRSREVTMFDLPARIPEGPLRLAALVGAPIVPVFQARTGNRAYRVDLCPALRIPRAAKDAEIDVAAQALASALERFVRTYPTQWFHFRET